MQKLEKNKQIDSSFGVLEKNGNKTMLRICNYTFSPNKEVCAFNHLYYAFEFPSVLYTF